MNHFEEKRAARIQRLIERARKKEAEANFRFEKSSKMASVIPFGQPILVGHHSERRDRNYRNKIAYNMDKGVELSHEAEYLRERARAAENNNAIFSDDPEAITKLREKLESLQKNQDLMKAVNAIVRKKNLTDEQKIEQIIKAGLKEKYAADILQPDYCGRIGFPSFSLTNNNANIKRIKDRIAHLEKLNAAETAEKKFGEVSIVENVEENRCQIFFPGKPSEAVRADLKSHGFRWSPYNSCWQRHRSNQATYYAEYIVKKHYQTE